MLFWRWFFLASKKSKRVKTRRRRHVGECLTVCWDYRSHAHASCVLSYMLTEISRSMNRVIHYPSTVFRVCSPSIAAFLFSFCFKLFYKFNRHLCHGAYCCTHRLAYMPIFILRPDFHLSGSCVCVCQLVYTLPSSSTFMYNYCRIHMYYMWRL